jgi:hypothetical protein
MSVLLCVEQFCIAKNWRMLIVTLKKNHLNILILFGQKEMLEYIAKCINKMKIYYGDI